MQISNCPRCQDPVCIPAGKIPAGAMARCPWCAEEFPLQDILDQLPPLLTILSDGLPPEPNATADSEPIAMAAAGGLDAGPTDVERFELTDGQPGLGETVPIFDDSSPTIIDAPAPGAADELVRAAPKIQSTRRRQSSGGLRSVIGVIFGGLLALPIAGGILWGLGLGPFADNGSPITNVFPTSTDDAPDLGFDSASAEADALEPMPVPDADSTSGREDSALSLPATASIDSRPAAPEESELSLPEPESAPGSDDASDANAVQPIATTVDSAGAIETASAENSERTESPLLVKMVGRADQMIAAIKEQEPQGEKRRHWLTTAYRTIARASEAANAGDPSLNRLVQLVRDSQLLDDFELAGSDWIELASRVSDGVLVIGISDGSSITMSSGKQVNVSGSVSLPPSGRVMAFGKILSRESMEATTVESL